VILTRRTSSARRWRALSLVCAFAFDLACAPDREPKLGERDVAPLHACGDELALNGRVADAAHILPEATRARLNYILQGYERRTQHQFVVVTVPTLGGSDLVLFSVRLFRRWGIGRRGVNDGMSLLVAPNEQRVRIEVGYGLERALPDDAAAKIIREVTLPRFKDGDLSGGIEATVTSVIARVDQAERKATPRVL